LKPVELLVQATIDALHLNFSTNLDIRTAIAVPTLPLINVTKTRRMEITRFTSFKETVQHPLHHQYGIAQLAKTAGQGMGGKISKPPKCQWLDTQQLLPVPMHAWAHWPVRG
jgi:hypothetical protein